MIKRIEMIEIIENFKLRAFRLAAAFSGLFIGGSCRCR